MLWPLQDELSSIKLVSLSVDGVADLLKNMKELQNSPNLDRYIEIIKSNNIMGSVLFYCDLNDLKNVSETGLSPVISNIENYNSDQHWFQIMQMTFGDWELFKVLIMSLREQQLILSENEDSNKTVKFHSNQLQQNFTSQDRKG